MQNSTPNEYSISIGSVHRVDRITNAASHTSEDDAHHDDLSEEELNAEYEYENEEEYWKPADQETRLKEQLVCLNVKEIPRKDLE